MRPRLVGVHRLHHRSGGAEAVHLDHLALFRERGWDCAEFTMDHPDDEPSAWRSFFLFSGPVRPCFEPRWIGGAPSLLSFHGGTAILRPPAR